MTAPSIAINAENPKLIAQAKALASQLKLKLCENPNDYHLVLNVTDKGLRLACPGDKMLGSIQVNFLEGALAHRRQYGGGRSQLLARAIGLSHKKNPSVLDLTAGLGRDAFVLACLGCHVTMIERQPIIAALLKDGLLRAEQADWFRDLDLALIENDGLHYLQTLPLEKKYDVIYLDPMYPDRKKSALVKKEMRILRELIGHDHDADLCLAEALHQCKGKKRIVVKRPRLAPALAGPEPDLVFAGKSSRFDVYF